MIIALACEEDRIAGRFAAARSFAIYEVDFGKVGAPTVAAPEGETHAVFLRGYAVDLVICGRISRTAQQSLLEEGIKFFGGVSGRADQALSAYLDGTLETTADFNDGEDEFV